METDELFIVNLRKVLFVMGDNLLVLEIVKNFKQIQVLIQPDKRSFLIDYQVITIPLVIINV